MHSPVDSAAMARRFNPRGTWTLFQKEVRRFLSVIGQTVLAPVVTAVLYLLVFQHVLEDRVNVYPGVGYTAFLIPGLVMMSIIQNAFANTSSSLTQSKIMGNLVFLLFAPLSAVEIFVAFVGAAIVRASCVAVGCGPTAQEEGPKAPGALAVNLTSETEAMERRDGDHREGRRSLQPVFTFTHDAPTCSELQLV